MRNPRIRGRMAGVRVTVMRQKWRRQRVKMQQGCCAACGVEFVEKHPWRHATLDHVVPLSKGGEDHFENTQALCRLCNTKKGDSLEGKR